MIDKGPKVSPAVAAAIIGIAVGGAAGYLVRDGQKDHAISGGGSSNQQTGRGGPGPSLSGGPGGGGAPSGGGPGGGGQAPRPGMLLARLVRNIGTVEKVQKASLTPAQSSSLLPILKELKAAEKLDDATAQAKIDAINKVLTDDQKKAQTELAPMGRGGGGGAPGGGGPGGGRGGSGGGPGGGGPGGGGPGGGGGRPDPEKPFASERAKQSLEDLIAHLDGSAKPK